MKRWIKIIENIFVSVTFAEMGEYHTSMEVFDMHSKDSRALWDDGCVSVTFADAG
jgi:hypothetical protein